MKVQYRIPATVKGTKENNFSYDVKNLFKVWRLYRKAKKEKAFVFFIFF